MSRMNTGRNVFDAAIDRLFKAYAAGHRLIVAFSAGKDSGALVECCIIAAKKAGALPVEIMFRDDEILYPGTAEYAERVAQRPEVNFHWIVNEQAATNIYNRDLPFYWCFDPELPRSEWVREYPPYAEIDRENIHLYYIVNTRKYQPPEGRKLVSVVGIRTEESANRKFAIMSAKGPRSYSPSDKRMFNLYPIYDWTAGDVWRAIHEFDWDYNDAYDVLYKMGVPRAQQRLSQIAMTPIGANGLAVAAKAWPHWWDRVTNRLPGIRNVVYYGDKVLRPIKRSDETWEECFLRTCLNNAPEWIMKRSNWAITKITSYHASHSNGAFPDVQPCPICKQSYKTMAWSLYCGDPFHIEIGWLPDVQAMHFRESETRLSPQSHRKMSKKMRDILAQ